MHKQLSIDPDTDVSEYAGEVRLANIRLLMSRLMQIMNQRGSWGGVNEVELDPHYSPQRWLRKTYPLHVRMLELPVIGHSPWKLAIGQDGHIYNLRPFSEVQIGFRMLKPPYRVKEQSAVLDDLERSLEQMLEQMLGS